MADVDIDASNLDDVADDLGEMAKVAVSEGRSLQTEISDDMIREIKRMIDIKFEETGPDNKDQISLRNSFHKLGNGDSVIITSKAPHARPLEEGVIPHWITPDTAEALSFTPENIQDYPPSVVDDGRVTLGRVFWTPDKNPAGWDYVADGQRKAMSFAQLKIDSSLNKIIRSGRFSRV